ncbi:MAG: hypothetical protein JXB39_00455, partial [Deltaproteobacteria bacterium]|nr:hypothetical protein [Deltaproteobacteria bacterium]
MSLPLAHPEDAASPPHKPTHSGLKHLADGLTALRLVGTPAIPLLGLARGPSVVSGAAGWLLLGLWLTDTF